jgi:tocopherol O-methyltransferase
VYADASKDGVAFTTRTPQGSSRGHVEQIARYYRDSDFDYNAVWRSNRNLARHFGFGPDGRRSGQFHDHAVLLANSRLADLAGIGPSTRVLDCGCGLGGTSIWLARERNAQVTGIDLLERQVERARREAARARVAGRTQFAEGDYTATRLTSESFDVVLAQESLCHAERKELFYQEAYRLLVPGGATVIAEYMRVARRLSPRREAMIREWCNGWVMPDLLTSQEHRAAAAAAGFYDVEILDGTLEVTPSLERLYRRAVYSYPFHQVLRACGFRNAVHHGNIMAARLQFDALKRGLWFYGLLRARK